MRFIILAALIACASAASIFDATMDVHWSNYKAVHGKNYGKEESIRRLIWEANLKFINQHNVEAANGVHRFRLAMNKYGDMTSEEFGAMYNGYNKTGEIKQRLGQAYKVSGSATLQSLKSACLIVRAELGRLLKETGQPGMQRRFDGPGF